MSDHHDRATRFRRLASECTTAARNSDSAAASEEFKALSKHYQELAEGEMSLAAARLLILQCPNRKAEFDSGILVSDDKLAWIEQIAVRILCPLCGRTHMLIEKGELDEGY